MLTPRQFEAIGRFTILFNELDLIVEVYLPLVIKYAKRTCTVDIAKANGFSKRVKAFRTALDIAVKDDNIAEAYAKAIREQLDLAKVTSQKRNEYVHAVALMDFQNNQRLLKTRRGEVVPDEAEMHDLASRSAVLAQMFAESCEELLRYFIESRA